MPFFFPETFGHDKFQYIILIKDMGSEITNHEFADKRFNEIIFSRRTSCEEISGLKYLYEIYFHTYERGDDRLPHLLKGLFLKFKENKLLAFISTGNDWYFESLSYKEVILAIENNYKDILVKLIKGGLEQLFLSEDIDLEIDLMKYNLHKSQFYYEYFQ